MNVFRCLMRFELILENFYAVESAWRAQRNSNIILREIPEAFHFFIIFFGHNGNIFLWISSEILMHSFCMSIEILLNSFYFFCISVFSFYAFLIFLKDFFYEFLMHVLCISCEILTHFLCNSYAFLMQFKSVWSF